MCHLIGREHLHAFFLAALLSAMTSVQAAEISKTAERARELGRQADQRRPDDQLLIKLFNRPLSIGGELKTEFDYRKDFELDASKRDDKLEAKGRIQVEAFYQWNDRLFLFAEAKASFENEVYAEFDDRERGAELERGQSWLYYSFDDNARFAMQLGRQNFRDKREWWWDSELDALRFHYYGKKWSAQMAVASELAATSNQSDIKPEEKDIVFFLSQITWEWNKKNQLSLFSAVQRDRSDTHQPGIIINERDEDDVDANLNWLGVRALGRVKLPGHGKLHYWADFAELRGTEKLIDFDNFDGRQRIVDNVEERRVKAWAYDLGLTWQADTKYLPRITIGQAVGSGGESADGSETRDFRQTGLHDNDVRLTGVNRFSFYGEAFRPELSNVRINTLAFGLALYSNSSVEFIFHDYRQRSRSRNRIGRIGKRPDGIHKDLGRELDIVLGIEESEKFEFQAVIAGFKAGRALKNGSSTWAFRVELGAKYNF